MYNVRTAAERETSRRVYIISFARKYNVMNLWYFVIWFYDSLCVVSSYTNYNKKMTFQRIFLIRVLTSVNNNIQQFNNIHFYYIILRWNLKQRDAKLFTFYLYTYRYFDWQYCNTYYFIYYVRFENDYVIWKKKQSYSQMTLLFLSNS